LSKVIGLISSISIGFGAYCSADSLLFGLIYEPAF